MEEATSDASQLVAKILTGFGGRVEVHNQLAFLFGHLLQTFQKGT